MQTKQHTPTTEQARKQIAIDAYIAARIRYMEAERAMRYASEQIGTASARMELHWWTDVPSKYR